MANEIKVYGRSDDLIEVEGAVREEFYANYGEPSVIDVSPGYVLEIVYDNDGIWRIDVVEVPERANYEFVASEATDSYSDIVRINHPKEDYEVSMRD